MLLHNCVSAHLESPTRAVNPSSSPQARNAGHSPYFVTVPIWIGKDQKLLSGFGVSTLQAWPLAVVSSEYTHVLN